MEGLLNSILNFFRAIWEAFQNLFQWLNDAFDAFVQFLMDLPAWAFSKIGEGIVSFFEAMPVPDFFTSAATAFDGIPPGVVFFAQAFHIGPGVTMVLGAYLLRFIVRRIPLIG